MTSPEPARERQEKARELCGEHASDASGFFVPCRCEEIAAALAEAYEKGLQGGGPMDLTAEETERLLEEDEERDRELYEYATGIAASKQVKQARADGDAAGFKRGIEAAAKANCWGCRNEWPFDDNDNSTHLRPTDWGTAFSCRSTAIRALAAQEEKK